MSLWRRGARRWVSALPRDLLGSSAFVQIGFPVSAFQRLCGKSCPVQYKVCLCALHNMGCEGVLLKSLPVSVSSLAPRARWKSLKDLLNMHKLKLNHSKSVHPQFKNFQCPWQKLLSFLCLFLSLPFDVPLSFSLSLTVSAITSHTAFFGKPPFFNDLAASRHWGLPEKISIPLPTASASPSDKWHLSFCHRQADQTGDVSDGWLTRTGNQL